jgi:hypothetical protein
MPKNKKEMVQVCEQSLGGKEGHLRNVSRNTHDTPWCLARIKDIYRGEVRGEAGEISEAQM